MCMENSSEIVKTEFVYTGKQFWTGRINQFNH